SGRIHGLVLSAVRERLLGSDLTPSAVPMRSDADDSPREDMRAKLAAFFKKLPPDAMAPNAPAPSTSPPFSLTPSPAAAPRLPLTAVPPLPPGEERVRAVSEATDVRAFGDVPPPNLPSPYPLPEGEGKTG